MVVQTDLRGQESRECAEITRCWSKVSFSGVSQTETRYLCTPGWTPLQVNDYTWANSSRLTRVVISTAVLNVVRSTRQSLFNAWPLCVQSVGPTRSTRLPRSLWTFTRTTQLAVRMHHRYTGCRNSIWIFCTRPLRLKQFTMFARVLITLGTSIAPRITLKSNINNQMMLLFFPFDNKPTILGNFNSFLFCLHNSVNLLNSCLADVIWFCCNLQPCMLLFALQL